MAQPGHTPAEGAGAAHVVTRDCPGCGGTACTPLPDYSRAPWTTVACDACGFVYLREAPVYDRLEEEFAWEKTFAAETERRAQARPAFSRVDRATRWRLALFRRDEAATYREVFGEGNVLDVGCGGGTRLPEPLVPFGIEISKDLAARADAHMQTRGGRTVQASAIGGLSAFPDGFFSGALLRSFLEHEIDPKGLLSGLHRVLRPGGAVYVKVPNFGSLNRRVMGVRWCGFRFPDHVNYFTMKSLADMARDCGYAIEPRGGLTRPVSDNLYAVLRKPVT